MRTTIMLRSYIFLTIWQASSRIVYIIIVSLSNLKSRDISLLVQKRNMDKLMVFNSNTFIIIYVSCTPLFLENLIQYIKYRSVYFIVQLRILWDIIYVCERRPPSIFPRVNTRVWWELCHFMSKCKEMDGYLWS